MFDEILRELEELENPRQISIPIELDDKGYYDRKCPSSECDGVFKVLFNDWRDKVQDERVFCPFCRQEAPSDKWHTPEQKEHIQSSGLAEMTRLFNDAMEAGVQRSQPTQIDAGLIKLTMSLSYTPGNIPPVMPAKATEELSQNFACEACGCRCASLGRRSSVLHAGTTRPRRRSTTRLRRCEGRSAPWVRCGSPWSRRSTLTPRETRCGSCSKTSFLGWSVRLNG